MIDQGFEKNSKVTNSVVDNILNCKTKDESGLNDFQKLPTDELIAIPRVGINRFRLPIILRNKEGEVRSHDATAAMYVDLNEKKNGVSMSRLCSILQTELGAEITSPQSLNKVIDRYRDELRDETDKDLIDEASLKLAFSYPVKQKSLRSANWGWQYYPVKIQIKHSKKQGRELLLTMTYEYSSTCPCSLSMAKQYEEEFRSGKTTEGSGIGVPHSQRSKLSATVKLDPAKVFFIEDLLMLIKEAIPTETQSLVKRADEQAFAILNGANPMFVEHSTKKIAKIFNQNSEFILDWLVEVEHLESLHSHNAAAVIFKGVEGGLSSDSIF